VFLAPAISVCAESDASQIRTLRYSTPFGLPRSRQWSSLDSGPFCGAIASAVAMRELGIEVPLSSLMRTRYVGGCGGSTTAEVVAVVRDHGLAAYPASNLSIADIQNSGLPFLAFVRGSKTDERFNHWVTVIPDGDDGLLLFDDGDDGKHVSVAEFSSAWSGVGVFVSRSDESPAPILILNRLIVVFVLATVWVFANSKPFQGAGFARGLITLMAIGCCVSGFFMMSTYDIKNYWNAVSGSVAYLDNLPEVELMDAIKSAKTNKTLLVDARRPADFQFDGLAEAVNIPVFASRDDIALYLADVPVNVPIVVYCQSMACSYDEEVAKRIVSLGFNNVAVSVGGIAEIQACVTEFETGQLVDD